MEIKPAQEFFGREINFEEIKNIKKVFQPGILNSPYFFNPLSLRTAVSELCGHSSKNIFVYFNEIEDFNIFPTKKENSSEWWKAFQSFEKFVEYFPAGRELEYWYSSNGKAISSKEFRKEKGPYQAFIRLFDNSLQGFSSFVSKNKISFFSTRCNYETIDFEESFIDDKKTRWIGDSNYFLESAQVLHDALSEMERIGYRARIAEGGLYKRKEVRIICPEKGALVSSLYGRDSVTFLLENASLEKIVKARMETRNN